MEQGSGKDKSWLSYSSFDLRRQNVDECSIMHCVKRFLPLHDDKYIFIRAEPGAPSICHNFPWPHPKWWGCGRSRRPWQATWRRTHVTSDPGDVISANNVRFRLQGARERGEAWLGRKPYSGRGSFQLSSVSDPWRARLRPLSRKPRRPGLQMSSPDEPWRLRVRLLCLLVSHAVLVRNSPGKSDAGLQSAGVSPFLLLLLLYPTQVVRTGKSRRKSCQVANCLIDAWHPSSHKIWIKS